MAPDIWRYFGDRAARVRTDRATFSPALVPRSVLLSRISRNFFFVGAAAAHSASSTSSSVPSSRDTLIHFSTAPRCRIARKDFPGGPLNSPGTMDFEIYFSHVSTCLYYTDLQINMLHFQFNFFVYTVYILLRNTLKMFFYFNII